METASLSTPRKIAIIALLTVISLIVAACGRTPTTPSGLSGDIEIDGSSTVYPITEAVAEEFQRLYSQVRLNVGISGTGGGFKRFVSGEIQIAQASRPITEREKQTAQEKGIEWIELKIALDGLAVVVNPANLWVEHLTVSDLKRLWETGSPITRWNQLRPTWPDQPVNLYGPGTDSGTFDYFTSVIVGKAGASRPDYTASEDDNILVQGISGDKNALGYFGYAYYWENRAKLRLIAIDGGQGPMLPSFETIREGSYQPLSRPLFLYVNKAALSRAEIKEFLRYYLTQGAALVQEVGYVPLSEASYQEELRKVK